MLPCLCQEVGPRLSLGVSTTFAPTSQHIFIGDAERRQIWTGDLDLNYRMVSKRHYSLWYEGSVSPFYRERDPTFVGTAATVFGGTVTSAATPVRVTFVNDKPVGVIFIGSGPGIPVYPLYSTQATYAFLINPVGFRINARPAGRVQPLFSTDFGLLFSARDLPVDDTSSFNFAFSFGPGLEYKLSDRKSITIEYLYRHISNANLGAQNPGIDAGVIRISAAVKR